MNAFFEQTCGPIAKSRLLGQSHHPTRIAFIEFARAESAMGALNCSGAMLGSFPIRYAFCFSTQAPEALPFSLFSICRMHVRRTRALPRYHHYSDAYHINATMSVWWSYFLLPSFFVFPAA